MIIVIKCLVDKSVERIPIHNYADIERLADRFPSVKKMEEHAHNPIELLQMFIRYISSGYYSAHLEDDGRKIKSKEEHKADKMKWQISKQIRRIKSPLARFAKSTKDTLTLDDDAYQGIVTQIKPQSGKFAGEETTPYKKRFSAKPIPEKNETPYNIDLTDMDSVESHKIDDKNWHHVGTKGNHKYHLLSDDKNPYSRGIAGIMTASHEGKNHIRAAFSDAPTDEPLDLLRSHVNAKPEYEYSEPIEIDAAKHSEKGWEGQHSDLIHGLVPDKTLQAPPNTVSSFISFAGVKGDTTPRVVAKEALRNWDRRAKPRGDSIDNRDAQRQESRQVSFFDAPEFSTAHREAAYSKLASNVFNLGEYVPRTTVFRHPLSSRPWSAMEFVKGAVPVTPETREADLKHLKDNGDLYKLAIMNVILGNNDRHMNNILKDPSGKIHLIDHGLTFDYGNQVRTAAVPKYVHDKEHDYSVLDEDIPESVHQWLWSLDIPKMANAMHEMHIPHDIIMNASQRLADARGWSNTVQHGRKDNPNVHKGLRYLFSIMRARNFDIDPREHGDIVERIRPQMMAGDKDKSLLVGDRNIPVTNHVPTRVPRTKKIGKDAIQDAATIPMNQAKTVISDDGKTFVQHPEEEVSKTHPTDSVPESKKDHKR